MMQRELHFMSKEADFGDESLLGVSDEDNGLPDDFDNLSEQSLANDGKGKKKKDKKLVFLSRSVL